MGIELKLTVVPCGVKSTPVFKSYAEQEAYLSREQEKLLKYLEEERKRLARAATAMLSDPNSSFYMIRKGLAYR
jgi:hypothetical protein